MDYSNLPILPSSFFPPSTESMKIELTTKTKKRIEYLADKAGEESEDFLANIVEAEIRRTTYTTNATFSKHCAHGHDRGQINFDNVVVMSDGGFACFNDGEVVGRMAPTKIKTHRVLIYRWYPEGNVVPDPELYAPIW